MGLAGYNGDFIPSFAAIAAHLSELTRKGQPNKVEWGEAQKKAYHSIKSHLTSEPILRLADPAETYFLLTDASSNEIGAVLMQRHDEKLFPVCYGSKKLSSAECNYSTIKECLVIVRVIKRFHIYICMVYLLCCRQTTSRWSAWTAQNMPTHDSCDGWCSYKVIISRWKPSKDRRMLERIILVEQKSNLRDTGLPLLYIS